MKIILSSSLSTLFISPLLHVSLCHLFVQLGKDLRVCLTIIFENNDLLCKTKNNENTFENEKFFSTRCFQKTSFNCFFFIFTFFF